MERHDRDEAALSVVNVATTVVLRAADIGDDLVRVTTPDDSRLSPELVEAGGRIQIHLPDTGQGGAVAVDVDVVVNRDVRWDLRFSGGATETVVDMTEGRLAALDFTAGSSRIEAVLPEPSGTTTIRMAGGASDFLVRVPDGVSTLVRADGGAGVVIVDGVRHSGVSGGTVFTPPDWDSAADRYDIDATAGVSTMTVQRT